MNFDWKTQYNGNLKWLSERTIYITRHGSHAYGTNTPESDLDIRGVCVAPKEYYLGFSKQFEQAIQNQPVDFTIFEIRKFFKLAAEANPNVLELLFTDPSDHLLVTPLGEMLFKHRMLFLSKKVYHTFLGYAHSQMGRIETHRRYILHPITHAPTREEFGLPEHTVIPADQLAAANSAIRKLIDTWNWHDLDTVEPAIRQSLKDEFQRRLVEITGWAAKDVEAKTWEAATKHLGFSTNFIELLDKERRYNTRHREWVQYNDWKKNRNPARAALEEKYLMDVKHAMHLARLATMCEEILTEGIVRVRRPDAEWLLSIRNGAWNYDALKSWFDEKMVTIKAALTKTKLPENSKREVLEGLCQEIVWESWKNG